MEEQAAPAGHSSPLETAVPMPRASPQVPLAPAAPWTVTHRTLPVPPPKACSKGQCPAPAPLSPQDAQGEGMPGGGARAREKEHPGGEFLGAETAICQ